MMFQDKYMQKLMVTISIAEKKEQIPNFKRFGREREPLKEPLQKTSQLEI